MRDLSKCDYNHNDRLTLYDLLRLKSPTSSKLLISQFVALWPVESLLVLPATNARGQEFLYPHVVELNKVVCLFQK